MNHLFVLSCVMIAIVTTAMGERAAPRFFAVDPSILLENKAALAAGDLRMKVAVKALVKEADKALTLLAPAVTDKAKAPSSGDKHDYMTSAPYYWPDPSQADGLPYIRHDGKVNPESRSDVYDHKRIGTMAQSVETLSLAYFFTGKEVYAKQAASFLRVWFLNPATRMTPHLEFAQAIPGKNTGRGTGIIEGRNLATAADAAGLLAGSLAWTTKENDALKTWLASYLDWILTSKNGKEEGAAKNNHGTFYDSQAMRIALILGRDEFAKKIAEEAKLKRIAVQIEPDGRQPLELERETALSYSRFNLEALFELATMAECVGVDLWHFKTADGRCLSKALDFLLPYAVESTKKWPYKQAKKEQAREYALLLAHAYIVYQDPRYQQLFQSLKGMSGARIQLLSSQKKPAEPSVREIERRRVLKAADAALTIAPISITQFKAQLSEGGINDFYSNGDYWWPDPSKTNGLPYIQRDGQTNPENFLQHRMAVRNLRDAVAALAAAYQLTHNEEYATKAADLLERFFLIAQTRMAPHLSYAQAIPGVSSGRGIGIIDTLHLIEVPVAIEALTGSKAFRPELVSGLKKWFSDYVDWMITSKNGMDEACAKNNHSVAFWLQVAVFSRFTGDEVRLAECRRRYKEVFVAVQMAPDGSFPLELARTKPYAYSIFQLDNMATLCHVLSSPKDDLWSFKLQDGRSIGKAVAYLYPFLADKSKWPLKPDVQAWDGWPTRQSSLLLTGLALHEQSYIDLWKRLQPDPADPEIQRNIAITQPLIWLK